MQKLLLPAPTLRPVLPWVLLLCMVFFANYTARAISGPLLVYMEQALGLTHSQATGLTMFMALGFTCSLALSSFVVSVIRPRHIIAASTVAMGVVLLAISQGQSLGYLRFTMSLLGVSAGLYFTSGMVAMASLVGRESWSKAIALHELAPPLSFILAPLIAEAGIALYGSWRGAFMLWGVCCIALGALFLFAFKGGMQTTTRPSLGGIKEVCKNPLVWFFAWCFTCGIAGEFAPYSVLSLHLTLERGMDAESAGRLLSATRVLSPAAVLLGGMLAPRLGNKRAMQLFLGLQGLCLILMGLPSMWLAVPGMFLQPLLPAFAFPTIFSILAQSFPVGQHPTILGLTMPIISYTGSGLTPKLLGVLGDNFSLSAGFMALGCISLLSLPFCRLLKQQ